MAASVDDKASRHVPKEEENKVLADLTGFPNLAAILAFENLWKKNRPRKNKKRRRKIEPTAQNDREEDRHKSAKLEEIVILSDDSDSHSECQVVEIRQSNDNHIGETRNWKSMKANKPQKQEKGDTVVTVSADHKGATGHVPKEHEYKVLADLTDFPNLAAVLASETSLKRNRKKKNMKKREIETQGLNDKEQHQQHPKQTATTEEQRLQELVVLPDTNKNQDVDSVHTRVIRGVVTRLTTELRERNKQKSSKDEKGRGDNVVVLSADKVSNRRISKENEYKMLADLSDFPNLAAVLAFEATLRENKQKNKMKRQFELHAQNDRNSEQMGAIEEQQLQELEVLPDDNDAGDIIHTGAICGVVKPELREENKEKSGIPKEERCANVVVQSADGHISKENVCKMLVNLSDSPHLAAVLASGTTWRENKKKNKMKRKFELQVQNDREQHKENPEQMGATEELVLRGNNDNGFMNGVHTCPIRGVVTTELGEGSRQKSSQDDKMGGDDVVFESAEKVSNGHISKENEYMMLADLSSFPNLAAALAFEATLRENRKTKKMKRKLELKEQNDRANASKEVPRTNTSKAVEGVEAFNAVKDAIPAVIVDICSSPSKRVGVVADLGNSEALKEMVSAETTEKRKWDNIEAQEDIVINVEEDKQADSSREVMPIQTETLNIMDDILPRKLLRCRRYFDRPVYSRHMAEDYQRAVNHHKRKWKKSCFLCGGSDHNAKQCKQVIDCYVCEGRGHLAYNCPEKHVVKEESATICLRCGNPGHNMFLCRSMFSPDDLKEIQCYVCKAFGHLCCVDYMGEDQGQVSCYKCGQSGHLGSDCTKLLGVLPPSKLCYKCGMEGHIARKCTKHPKVINSRQTGS